MIRTSKYYFPFIFLWKMKVRNKYLMENRHKLRMLKINRKLTVFFKLKCAKMAITQKNKNLKLDFSFDSAESASFM